MKTNPSDSQPENPSEQILDISLDILSYSEVNTRVLEWAKKGESRTVCTANVHMVMLAQDAPAFKAVLEKSDIITADGMPLVWLLRRRGYTDQERVYGPTLMEKLLASAEGAGIPVGFLGSSQSVLDNLIAQVKDKHPQIKIVYAYSPPYREFKPTENDEMIAEVNRSGTKILFVGLGCPKQEIWINAHKGDVKAVMLGVGAAFDFIAGTKKQAPPWVQRMGMEWFFRLLTEPQRLWKRYLVYNPRFITALAREWIQNRLGTKHR